MSADNDHRCVFTLQIGDPSVIAERSGIDTIADFRRADVAAGGQGAPLVPAFHATVLRPANGARVVLNLGGIANVTRLSAAGEVTGFDTGPANMLLDAFVTQRTNGRLAFDRDGALARRGRVDEATLEAMRSDEFFALAPPKTTGRERFGEQFLSRHAKLADLSLEDGAATLTELTAASIAQAIRYAGFGDARVIVSGGGAYNRALVERIKERLGSARVEASDAMGVPAEAKEAMAFAILGYETLRERAGNVPAATGARHGAVLGAIAPERLRELLARVDRECTPSS